MDKPSYFVCNVLGITLYWYSCIIHFTKIHCIVFRTSSGDGCIYIEANNLYAVIIIINNRPDATFSIIFVIPTHLPLISVQYRNPDPPTDHKNTGVEYLSVFCLSNLYWIESCSYKPDEFVSWFVFGGDKCIDHESVTINGKKKPRCFLLLAHHCPVMIDGFSA